MLKQPEYTSIDHYVDQTVPVDQLVMIFEKKRAQAVEELGTTEDTEYQARLNRRIARFDLWLNRRDEMENALIPFLKSKGVRRIGIKDTMGQYGIIAPLGDNQLLRISMPEYEDRYDLSSLPIALQSLASWDVGSFKVDLTPMVNTKDVTDEQVVAAYHLAQAFGFFFWDCKRDNVGLLENDMPVIIDQGAVIPMDYIDDVMKVSISEEHEGWYFRQQLKNLKNIERGGRAPVEEFGILRQDADFSGYSIASDTDSMSNLANLIKTAESFQYISHALPLPPTNLLEAKTLIDHIYNDGLSDVQKQQKQSIEKQLQEVSIASQAEKMSYAIPATVQAAINGVNQYVERLKTDYAACLQSTLNNLSQSLDNLDIIKAHNYLSELEGALNHAPNIQLSDLQKQIKETDFEVIGNTLTAPYHTKLADLSRKVFEYLPASKNAKLALKVCTNKEYFGYDFAYGVECLERLVNLKRDIYKQDFTAQLDANKELKEEIVSTLKEAREFISAALKTEMQNIHDQILEHFDTITAGVTGDAQKIEKLIIKGDYKTAIDLGYQHKKILQLGGTELDNLHRLVDMPEDEIHLPELGTVNKPVTIM